MSDEFEEASVLFGKASGSVEFEKTSGEWRVASFECEKASFEFGKPRVE